MARPRHSVAAQSDATPATPPDVCTTCGRRLRPVYPKLASLGTFQAWSETELVCVGGCEAWVHAPGAGAWVRKNRVE